MLRKVSLLIGWFAKKKNSPTFSFRKLWGIVDEDLDGDFELFMYNGFLIR
jgi:hypothetical protein